HSPAALAAVDKHALRFQVGDVAWLTLPGHRDLHIPAMLQIRLPDTVVYGQEFRVSVHQVSGRTGRVVGAIEFGIPVSHAEMILEEEERTLSVMRHIATSIPPENRWYPIFQRYLHGLARRVDALGGDASTVHGNPDGSGNPYVRPVRTEPGGLPCWPGVATALILAVALVLSGFARSIVVVAVAAAAAMVLLAGVIRWWSRSCCGRLRCAVLDYLALGSGAALAVLVLAAVAGVRVVPQMLIVAALFTASAVIGSFLFRCRGGCCDTCCDDCHCRGREVSPTGGAAWKR
ncbi:MAG TPA: hypothetical protein VGV85_02465, partial [Longimicrobiaceae bacterium]|nr:hypothetical protein [Longimicrobiaceae bacterium]